MRVVSPPEKYGMTSAQALEIEKKVLKEWEEEQTFKKNEDIKLMKNAMPFAVKRDRDSESEDEPALSSPKGKKSKTDKNDNYRHINEVPDDFDFGQTKK